MHRGIRKIVQALCLLVLLGTMAAAAADVFSEKVSWQVSKDTSDYDTNLTVVGFSQPGAESAWRVALTDSVVQAFTEERGYKLIYEDGQSKQDNQIKAIRKFIQQGVDYIILSPLVETGWDTVLQEAKLAGIPVIVCDRSVSVVNQSLYKAFVGSDFKSEGQKAVIEIEKLLTEQGLDVRGDTTDDGQVSSDVICTNLLGQNMIDTNGGEVYASDVKIVHLQGTIGSSAQKGRTKALMNAVEDHDNWKIIYQACGDFTNAKAQEVARDLFTTIDTDDIDVIYCENDEMALGLISTMKDMGIEKDFIIVSFDATKNGLNACVAGDIDLVMECNPAQGQYVYKIIEQIEEGTTPPKITYVYESSYDHATLHQDFVDQRNY